MELQTTHTQVQLLSKLLKSTKMKKISKTNINKYRVKSYRRNKTLHSVILYYEKESRFTHIIGIYYIENLYKYKV